MQYGAASKADPLDAELVQPAPSRRIAVDLDERLPQRGDGHGKGERVVVFDDVVRHALHATHRAAGDRPVTFAR